MFRSTGLEESESSSENEEARSVLREEARRTRKLRRRKRESSLPVETESLKKPSVSEPEEKRARKTMEPLGLLSRKHGYTIDTFVALPKRRMTLHSIKEIPEVRVFTNIYCFEYYHL